MAEDTEWEDEWTLPCGHAKAFSRVVQHYCSCATLQRPPLATRFLLQLHGCEVKESIFDSSGLDLADLKTAAAAIESAQPMSRGRARLDAFRDEIRTLLDEKSLREIRRRLDTCGLHNASEDVCICVLASIVDELHLPSHPSVFRAQTLDGTFKNLTAYEMPVLDGGDAMTVLPQVPDESDRGIMDFFLRIQISKQLQVKFDLVPYEAQRASMVCSVSIRWLPSGSVQFSRTQLSDAQFQAVWPMLRTSRPYEALCKRLLEHLDVGAYTEAALILSQMDTPRCGPSDCPCPVSTKESKGPSHWTHILRYTAENMRAKFIRPLRQLLRAKPVDKKAVDALIAEAPFSTKWSPPGLCFLLAESSTRKHGVIIAPPEEGVAPDFVQLSLNANAIKGRRDCPVTLEGVILRELDAQYKDLHARIEDIKNVARLQHEINILQPLCIMSTVAQAEMKELAMYQAELRAHRASAVCRSRVASIPSADDPVILKKSVIVECIREQFFLNYLQMLRAYKEHRCDMTREAAADLEQRMAVAHTKLKAIAAQHGYQLPDTGADVLDSDFNLLQEVAIVIEKRIFRAGGFRVSYGKSNGIVIVNTGHGSDHLRVFLESSHARTDSEFLILTSKRDTLQELLP